MATLVSPQGGEIHFDRCWVVLPQQRGNPVLSPRLTAHDFVISALLSRHPVCPNAILQVGRSSKINEESVHFLWFGFFIQLTAIQGAAQL